MNSLNKVFVLGNVFM